MALHPQMVEEGLVASTGWEMRGSLIFKSSNKLFHHGLRGFHGIIDFQNARFLLLRPPYLHLDLMTLEFTVKIWH
ncbi:Nuclear poly(A) polymerase 3 [Senna tora]|uniref:Nuclear poly(A) polymerase 3 n=1 Tax=Senna tora TaxID=362788 RepID=A0A834WG58_9FABA|nr:Nuclear poly(A) polymerase 3 [Senna tora]